MAGSGGTLSAEAGRRSQVLVPRLLVEVLSGPDRGRSFHSRDATAVIGTHPSADMRLDDPTVSRFHCEMTVTERGVRLRDLGSYNGTFAGELEVVDGYFSPPCTLRVGDTTLRVVAERDTVSVAVAPSDRFGPMYGVSQAMRAVFALLERAADSDATVLLEAESGCGKDIAAAAIHGASPRRDGPLVVVDCGALPRGLLESELFGHVRGAFTGAEREREGAFVAASGGTLFLDEIGELDRSLQPTLLRAVESRRIRPVGSDREIPVDIRVIAATNRSLRAEVNARRFRSDLYYRLAVLTVRIPPLRERPEDIPGLIEDLLERAGQLDHPAADELRSLPVLEHLSQLSWPGNVRELRNHIEKALVLGDLSDAQAVATAVRSGADPAVPYRAAKRACMAEFERTYLEALMKAHDNNVTAAARAAGVDRVHMHRLLSRAGLR